MASWFIKVRRLDGEESRHFWRRYRQNQPQRFSW